MEKWVRLANIRKINKRKQKPEATQPEFGLCAGRAGQEWHPQGKVCMPVCHEEALSLLCV